MEYKNNVRSFTNNFAIGLIVVDEILLFGILDSTTVLNFFAEEIYENFPNDKRCVKFSDDLVRTYISPEFIFPPARIHSIIIMTSNFTPHIYVIL